MNDETIRLVLDLASSSKDVGELSTKLHTLDKDLEEAGSQAATFAGSTEKVEAATAKLGKTGANTGQSLLQGGRVLQDFAQGGLGGILNNIEGLTMALGLGSGMAGVLTVIGVVALTAGPSIKSFFQSLIDGSNEVPKAKGDIEGLTQTIRENGEALDAMRKQQTLTNSELVRFNVLTLEQIGLEKKLAQAKKERAEQDKLDALRPQAEVDKEQERADELQAGLAGRQEELAAIIDKEIEAQKAQALKTAINAGIDDPERLKSHRRVTELEAIQARGGGKALAAGAMIGGREADVRKALEFLPEFGRAGDFRRDFSAVLPGGANDQWDAEQRAFQEGNDAAHEARLRREAKAKEAKKQAKLNDEVDQAEKDAAKGAQEMVNAADMDLQQGIKRGRQIGDALSKQKRRSLIPKDLGHIPLIPLNASPEQAARQMDLNAAKATASAVGIMSGLTSEVELLSAQNRRNLDMLKMRERQISQFNQQSRSQGSNGFPN